jgi:hypothetical protein
MPIHDLAASGWPQAGSPRASATASATRENARAQRHKWLGDDHDNGARRRRTRHQGDSAAMAGPSLRTRDWEQQHNVDAGRVEQRWRGSDATGYGSRWGSSKAEQQQREAMGEL